MTEESTDSLLFKDIFFEAGQAKLISVPDYQRAYSWEVEQIDLFIKDLKKYKGLGGYYFGHFIVEASKCDDAGGESSGHWKIVDGQQRLTTFVLFLMICRHRCKGGRASVFSMIERFSTVRYDRAGFSLLCKNLRGFLESNIPFNPRKLPGNVEIMDRLDPSKESTHSQVRMALALLRFNHAFEKGDLDPEYIADYIEAVMQSHCSCHITHDKSVAVNIFEMHNTRGVPLSTLEILKAKLMQFVYSKSESTPEEKVEEIQDEFGKIYAMEESLARTSFRGDMTMDNLLRQHLRVIDDGTKETAESFRLPSARSSSSDLIKHVEDRLQAADALKMGKCDYPIKLARELAESARIVSEELPEWDRETPLVGDVMILERELSCQWFLLICRRFPDATARTREGVGGNNLLSKWERLLFTRDFHEQYHGLRYRDNFETLFESVRKEDSDVSEILEGYIANGFRPDCTKGLQEIVRKYIEDNRLNILGNAYHWWRGKMIYVLYKYEASQSSNIRTVMKDGISVEHILPQEWSWEWISADEKSDEFEEKILKCINGIGNLLLLTPGENSAAGNLRPSVKSYDRYMSSGSYKWHSDNRDAWADAKRWEDLIKRRGEDIYDFISEHLIGQWSIDLKNE